MKLFCKTNATISLNCQFEKEMHGIHIHWYIAHSYIQTYVSLKGTHFFIALRSFPPIRIN